MIEFLRILDWTTGIATLTIGLWLGSVWLTLAGFIGTAFAYFDVSRMIHNILVKRLTKK